MSSTNDDYTDVKTIRIDGFGRRSERLAASAVLPGMLVEVNSSDKVLADSTSGGGGNSFAVEDDLQGNTTSTSYATGVLVQYERFEKGQGVLGRLANGVTAVIGSKLTSNGDGFLKLATGTDLIVGRALAAVDMSGSDAVDPSGFIPLELS